jgi:hypothetical protein
LQLVVRVGQRVLGQERTDVRVNTGHARNLSLKDYAQA